MATMRESAHALLRIIDDVLDFSKIEAGVVELEEAPFSLTGVVEGKIRALRPSADKRGLTLIPAVAAGSIDTLQRDVTRVRQILYNLVSPADNVPLRDFLGFARCLRTRASSMARRLQCTTSASERPLASC